MDKEELAQMEKIPTTDSKKKGITLFANPSDRRLGSKNSFELMQE